MSSIPNIFDEVNGSTNQIESSSNENDKRTNYLSSVDITKKLVLETVMNITGREVPHDEPLMDSGLDSLGALDFNKYL